MSARKARHRRHRLEALATSYVNRITAKPDTEKRLDFVYVASKCAKSVHEGEPLKYVDGPYYFHVKDVAARMHTIPEKVVALLHDVVESEIKLRMAHMRAHPEEPALFRDEEEGIKQILEELRVGFAKRGHDLGPLLGDINVLTKRAADKNEYERYIQRIIEHALRTGSLIAVKVKMADLADNMAPERNPPLSKQTPKDVNRLSRYGWAYLHLTMSVPEITLRPVKHVRAGVPSKATLCKRGRSKRPDPFVGVDDLSDRRSKRGARRYHHLFPRLAL